MKNFYAMLVTDANCNQAEIQSAYEKLMADYLLVNNNNRRHKQQFNKINQAYQILSNPESRYKYDQQFKKIHQPKQFYTKAIDLTFSIILVFFTIVFADYVITSINHSKAAKLHKAAIKLVAAAPKIHHKKHSFRIKTADYTIQDNPKVAKPDTATVPISTSQVAEQKVVTTDYSSPDKTVTKIAEKQDAQPEVQAEFLYATRLKANETGIVNLRQYANYGSGVIKVIPSGAQVFVLERGDNYYKVKFEDNVGFVPKWTLETK